MRILRCSLLVAGLLAAAAATALGAPPQSPIIFQNAALAELHVPQFNYASPVNLTLTTQNHAATGALPGNAPAKKKIEATLTNPMVDIATLTINTDTYKLKEFHLHHRQEHVLGANDFPLELHLVHEHSTIAGKFLAVGLWIHTTPSLGAENAALAQIVASLPAGPAVPGPDQTANIAAFALADLKPSNGLNFFRYDGSLTTFKTNAEATANASETAVTWIFYKDPLVLTEAKINTLAGHPAMTSARPPFPMNANTHMLQMHVPEPSTVWLLAVAGLVVAGRRGRRLHTSATTWS